MNWSEKYYESLNDTQHKINNEWFKNMLRYLKDFRQYNPSINTFIQRAKL